jgi:hypothetical protein
MILGVVWPFILRWWREVSLGAFGLVLIFGIPSYFKLAGRLRACETELAKPLVATGEGTAKIRIVYRDKSIPCPDIEVDTTAKGSVEGTKNAPQRPETPFSVDFGVSSNKIDWKALNGVVGVNYGVLRGFAECDLTGVWRIGGGYVFRFQGAE